jgi:hypothetical protein
MFKEARIKLTGWYLLIIMAISLSFSVAIYVGVNSELTRIGDLQKARQARVDTISNFLRQNGLPVPPEVQSFSSRTYKYFHFGYLWSWGIFIGRFNIGSDFKNG